MAGGVGAHLFIPAPPHSLALTSTWQVQVIASRDFAISCNFLIF